MFHDKSKHSEFRYIRDMVQKGAVKLKYVPKEEQVENVLAKPLSNVGNYGLIILTPSTTFFTPSFEGGPLMLHQACLETIQTLQKT